MSVLAVALDLLREARSRRWVAALAAATTLLLLAVALGLHLEVVDGALAATRFFGAEVRTDVRSVDVALRPFFAFNAYLVYYGGLLFSIVATADFAPALLAPGRIEQLLALPLRRWELLAGTLLGVEALVLGGALYGGAGLWLILWAKTGVSNPAPLVAALCAAVAFAPIYAAMLGASVLARSAALSTGAGLSLLAAGLLAGRRLALAELFERGAGRTAFLALTALLPRLSSLGGLGPRVALGEPLQPGPALALAAGTVAFALGLLALAIAAFERKDY